MSGFLNRLRAAWKAFIGDTVNLSRFGVEVKSCKQCDRVTPQDILYICDRKYCDGGCPNSECRHTRDINHAVNFAKYEGDWGPYFVELERATKEENA